MKYSFMVEKFAYSIEVVAPTPYERVVDAIYKRGFYAGYNTDGELKAPYKRVNFRNAWMEGAQAGREARLAA